MGTVKNEDPGDSEVLGLRLSLNSIFEDQLWTGEKGNVPRPAEVVCGSEHFQEIASNRITAEWTQDPQALCPNSSASKKDSCVSTMKEASLFMRRWESWGAVMVDIFTLSEFIHPFIQKSC